MTGNSDLRERLGAVFFALIMVTSMVAVGMAGGAAATQGDSYPDTEPGNLTVFVIDNSGTIQENFSVNTGDNEILRNGSSVFSGINSTLNNTAKVIEFAANNATSTNNTVVVGPGEYNVSSAAGVGTDIKIENSDVSRIYAHNQTSDPANRAELNTTDGSVKSLIEVSDGSLSSLEIGTTGSNAPSQAGGIFFNSSQAGNNVDALNVTDTADSFSLTFENNNVSVGSADGVVFNGQSTAPSVTVNSNTLTGVTSFVNITGVVDNATVSGSITGNGETGLNFTNSSEQQRKPDRRRSQSERPW
jgi:surface glycoprotein (TIGR04207 family)